MVRMYKDIGNGVVAALNLANLKAVAIQHMARCLFRWSDCRQLRLRVRNRQPLRSRRLCGPRLVIVEVTSILTCVPVGLCSLP